MHHFFLFLLCVVREIVEDHSPTDNMTSTSSLELSASATANLSTSPTPLRTPSEGCAARTLTMPELLSSGTGLMNNWEEPHSVETMEMQMIYNNYFILFQYLHVFQYMSYQSIKQIFEAG